MTRLRSAALAVALVLAATVAHAEKVLRYAFLQAETGFDPAQVVDLYSRTVMANIFDAPLRHAWLSDQVEPNTLSAMPQASPDFKSWTFHVRPGIYFADDRAFGGNRRELVAEDYVYSFKRLYDPKNKGSGYSDLAPYAIDSLERLRQAAISNGHFDYDTQVEGIKAIDRYTYRISLGVSSPRFASGNLYAAALFGAVAREVVEAYGDEIMQHPVGTGPFMLAEWVRASHLNLIKNPNYRVDLFDAHPRDDDQEGQALAKSFNGRRMPFLDRVEISIVEESQPRWLAFLNAEHDVMPQVPTDLAQLAMPNNKLAPNLARKHLQARREVLLREQMLVFNMDDAVVGGYSADKVALRRAIGLGLDVPRLIALTQSYEAIPAQSAIYPQSIGYQPTLRTEMGQFDLPRARAMLDSYGYRVHPGSSYRDQPDGSALTLTFNSAPDQLNRAINEIVKRSMDQLGLRLVVNIAPWPSLLQAARSGAFQMWHVGLSGNSDDAVGTMQAYFGPGKGGSNLSRFDLPEFNQLYLKQDAEPDGLERLETIARMRDLLIAYAPAKTTWHPIGISLAYPWVKGFRFDSLVADWWRYVDVDEAVQRPHLN